MTTAPERPPAATTPHRGLMMIVVGSVVLFAVVGLRYIQERVAALVVLAERQPEAAEQGLLELARNSLAFTSAVLAVSGLLMARMAWRAWQSETFPPPGAWLLRETVPATGASARRRAIAAMSIAVLTVALAVWLPRKVLDRIQDATARARDQRAPIEWNQPAPVRDLSSSE